MGTSAYMYTYLGVFDKVAEWIFSGISKALTWLFKSVFGPIFTAVLEPVATEIINMVMVALSSIFYDIFRGLLRLIDIIQTSFMIFAGVTPVMYKGKSYSLVELFFTDNAVGTSFRGILILAITLCFVFTIISVIRKMADLELEQQRSIGMILSDTIKSLIGFFILPVGGLAAIYLAGAVLTSVYSATAQSSGAGSARTIATTLFEVSVSGAIDDLQEEDSSKYNKYQNTFLKQTNPNPWENVISDNDSGKDEYCIDYYIDLWNIDYVVGYFSAIFLIWNLLAVSFAFVQRIFEIILLYLVSPFFMAVMPLDAGEKLKKWESMFVSKLAGGMGQIIMVNLYLMLVPIVMNGDINLTGGTVGAGNRVYDALIRLVFLLGAAMAVKNGATLFTSLMDYQSGMAEQDTMRGGMMAVSSVARKGVKEVDKFAKKRADGAPQRKAKRDGYRFAKAEKNYNNRMRKADELEKKGFHQEAEHYRSSAASNWNLAVNHFAKKGMISRSGEGASGYTVQNSAFKYGMKKKQHKRGIFSLPHKAEKAAAKTVSAAKTTVIWGQNKTGILKGFQAYRKNVKGVGHDHADRAKGSLKRTSNMDRYTTDAVMKGVEKAEKRFSGPMPEKREPWASSVQMPEKQNAFQDTPGNHDPDILNKPTGARAPKSWNTQPADTMKNGQEIELEDRKDLGK